MLSKRHPGAAPREPGAAPREPCAAEPSQEEEFQARLGLLANILEAVDLGSKALAQRANTAEQEARDASQK
jgi:hypothetical protein